MSFGGKGGKSNTNAAAGDLSGITSMLESLVPDFQNLSNQAAALSPILFGQGQNDIYPTALGQYQAGASGQLTPAQQAAVAQTKQQMDLQTAGNYGNLGLGGSTMEGQDINANAQKSLAQTQGFAAQDEQLGLSGLAQALGFENAGVGALGTAGGILSGATGALSGAGSAAGSLGNIGLNQTQQKNSGLSSLGTALGGKGDF